MRHNKKFNHLGRKSAHRKTMLSNMANSLIESKRITTTVAKAKALRIYVEPLITKAKNDTTHSRRIVFSHLQNKYAVSELFREVAAKIGDRPGGYTRILRTGNRLGDNAEMCIIELVDYNEAMLASKSEAEKPKRRRSRRGGSSKKSQSPATESDKQKETQVEKEDVTAVDKKTSEPVEDKKTEKSVGDESIPEATNDSNYEEDPDKKGNKEDGDTETQGEEVKDS